MGFLSVVVALSFWIIVCVHKRKDIFVRIQYIIAFFRYFSNIFYGCIEGLLFIISSGLFYELISFIIHSRACERHKRLRMKYNENIEEKLKNGEVRFTATSKLQDEIMAKWKSNESITNEINHINYLILKELFGSKSLLSQSLNSDLYSSVQNMLLSSEQELLKAFIKPDIFFLLCNSFLTLLKDNLSSYRLMREQAAYANHDLFFAKHKNRSYDPQHISGYFSQNNLKERHIAVEHQYRIHNLLHPALRDDELCAVYMRYLSQQLYRVLLPSSSSPFLRDIICDVFVTEVMLPCCSFLTPSRINKLLYSFINGEFNDICNVMTMMIMISNHESDLNKASQLQVEDSMHYLTNCCSRFQADAILLHAPIGSFFIRTCQPFSNCFVLSYSEEKREINVINEETEKERLRTVVTHQMIWKKNDGYEFNSQHYTSFSNILTVLKDKLHYGIRLDAQQNVIACDSMPWFNKRRVREIKVRKHKGIDAKGIELDLLRKSYDKYEEDEASMIKRMNSANDSFKRRYLTSQDEEYINELSLSWMSGLDEVEEWLRQRTFLLHSLEVNTQSVITEYMKLPERAIGNETPAVQKLIDAYIAILDYKRKPTIAGIWVILQKASIPSRLIRITHDMDYAKKVISYLLNTQNLRNFLASFSRKDWSMYYRKSSILMIEENKQELLQWAGAIAGVKFSIAATQERIRTRTESTTTSVDISPMSSVSHSDSFSISGMPEDFDIFGLSTSELSTHNLSDVPMTEKQTEEKQPFPQATLISDLMLQIASVDISDYKIVWEKEESKNIVQFAMRIFTQTQTWTLYHRYSTLYRFHKAIQHLLPRGFPPFPPKQFGTKSNFDPDYLKVRCVGLNNYFQSILICTEVRKTKHFAALFVPNGDIEDIPNVEKVEKEDETTSEEEKEEEYHFESEPFQHLQTLETHLFEIVDEVLQADNSTGLVGKLHILLENASRIITGGSLYAFYESLESHFLNSSNVAFILGLIRVFVWSEDEWYLKDFSIFMDERQEDEDVKKNDMEKARNALLSNLPDSFIKCLESYESSRTIRLSLLRVFEQFQSELMCKNFCLHFMDMIISILYPKIEVWSHLVEIESDSEDEDIEE